MYERHPCEALSSPEKEPPQLCSPCRPLPQQDAMQVRVIMAGILGTMDGHDYKALWLTAFAVCGVDIVLSYPLAPCVLYPIGH